MRTIYLVMAAAVLAGCGKSPDGPAPAGQPTAEPTQAAASEPKAAAAGDPCSLVGDAEALFGVPVTATVEAMPNSTSSCEWKSADTRICGSLTVFGPGFNDLADPKTNYSGMTTSLAAFGPVQDVAGVGEEAKVVDGGILGVQLAFRTSKSAALVASACSSGPHSRNDLVLRLAREVAPKL